MDHPEIPSFEQFAAARLRAEREQITRDWVERLSSRLEIAPQRVLPDPDLLDDMPLVLEKSAEFLVVPDAGRVLAEESIIEEMRRIALLRHRQGCSMQEVVREFDELAQLLDGAALEWIPQYPGVPDAESVGRTFGRLNRVPLLMGQIMVGTLEAERRELLQQLASAEEEERTRLSRELHDHLGQLLTALGLGLRSLRSQLGVGEQSARIEELERLADRIAREAQQLALDLRPPALDNLGLRSALEAFAGEWSARTGIECDTHCAVPEHERFSPVVETTLYRVAQEGLNNVLKHAGATRTGLILERRGRFLTLILEDDGRGFDVEAAADAQRRAKRLGLRGMRERVALLGGQMEVESSPGSGTTLFVRIPEEIATGEPAGGRGEP